MLMFEKINFYVVIIVSIVILICSVGIIIATRFQQKQQKKYKEVRNLVKNKENSKFEIKNGLSKDEINNIDSSLDVDNLMISLYNTYLELENRTKLFDSNLDGVLTGYLKEFYTNKITNFKIKNYSDITDGIELLGYSITEFTPNKLKFRININCFNYKKVNEKIISGSNLERIEEVLILTYEKVNNNWLISNYEKVYERKLSN